MHMMRNANRRLAVGITATAAVVAASALLIAALQPVGFGEPGAGSEPSAAGGHHVVDQGGPGVAQSPRADALPRDHALAPAGTAGDGAEFPVQPGVGVAALSGGPVIAGAGAEPVPNPAQEVDATDADTSTASRPLRPLIPTSDPVSAGRGSCKWRREVGPAQDDDLADVPTFDELLPRFATQMMSNDGIRRALGLLSGTGDYFLLLRYGDMGWMHTDPAIAAMDPIGFEPRATLEFFEGDRVHEIRNTNLKFAYIGDGYVRPGVELVEDDVRSFLVFEGVERLSVDVLYPTDVWISVTAILQAFEEGDERWVPEEEWIEIPLP